MPRMPPQKPKPTFGRTGPYEAGTPRRTAVRCQRAVPDCGDGDVGAVRGGGRRAAGRLPRLPARPARGRARPRGGRRDHRPAARRPPPDRGDGPPPRPPRRGPRTPRRPHRPRPPLSRKHSPSPFRPLCFTRRTQFVATDSGNSRGPRRPGRLRPFPLSGRRLPRAPLPAAADGKATNPHHSAPRPRTPPQTGHDVTRNPRADAPSTPPPWLLFGSPLTWREPSCSAVRQPGTPSIRSTRPPCRGRQYLDRHRTHRAVNGTHAPWVYVSALSRGALPCPAPAAVPRPVPRSPRAALSSRPARASCVRRPRLPPPKADRTRTPR